MRILFLSNKNCLTQSLLDELAAAYETLADDPVVNRISIESSGTIFLSGADLSFFSNSLSQGRIDDILEFTRRGHALLASLCSGRKQTFAKIQGMAIGAGLEMALACERIVGLPGAKFCLPETGLGIYPGMGGTQRLPRRIGVGLAKWMLYTGAIVPADHALEIGLLDNLATSTREAAEADEPASASPIPRVLGDRFRQLEDLFTTHDVRTLCDPQFTVAGDPQLTRALVQVRGKAPLALRLAEQIIDQGMKLPIEQAIELEFSHLREIFSSEDARIGLASVGQSRPRFVGR